MSATRPTRPDARLPAGGAPVPAERLLWLSDEGVLLAEKEPAAAPLLVDSWLLEDGRVRALERHEERFRRSCARLLPSLRRQTLDAFLLAVRASLPREGRWFPRVEAHAGPHPRLALRLRAAPAYPGPIALWVPPHPDPRRNPLHKGPDLQALAALREQARLAGAEDALLYTPGGEALESAHHALLWWRGDTLCAPAAPVLPSVTGALIVGLADRLGIEVSHERCRLDELGALRVWAVNALHGIRPVSRWVGLNDVEATR